MSNNSLSPPAGQRRRSRSARVWQAPPRARSIKADKVEAKADKVIRTVKARAAKAEIVKGAKVEAVEAARAGIVLPLEIEATLNDWSFLPPKAIAARVAKVCGWAADPANPHLPERAWGVLARMLQAVSFLTSN
jgi:hypothetical protein